MNQNESNITDFNSSDLHSTLFLSLPLTLGQSWDICVGSFFFHKGNYFCEAIRTQSHRSHHLFQAVNDLKYTASAAYRKDIYMSVLCLTAWTQNECAQL